MRVITAVAVSIVLSATGARCGPLEDAERMQASPEHQQFIALAQQEIVSLCENRFPYQQRIFEVCVEKQKLAKEGVDKLVAGMWHLHNMGDRSDRIASDVMKVANQICTNKAMAASDDYKMDWVVRFYCFKQQIDERVAISKRPS
jgi:hypothetical protein